MKCGYSYGRCCHGFICLTGSSTYITDSVLYLISDEVDEDDLGSSEESGKDWDELEEEARRGN